MRITDQQFEEMLSDIPPEEIPEDMSREELRQRFENLLDLIKIFMQPDPLPPAHTADLTPLHVEHLGDVSPTL